MKGGEERVIYNKIKKMCEAKNISIHKLEVECGLGNNTVNRWKNVSPRVDNLKKVAEYFGVSIEFLMKE